MRAWHNKSSRVGRSAAAATDDDRLDLAMQRADDLLVKSLHSDERKRHRRKSILITLGGLAMLATLCLVVFSVMLWSGTADSAVAADQSAQLTQQGWKLWQSDPNAAREKFTEAVALAPKNTSAWNGLGWCDFNAGRRKEATAAFQKVISLEPGHAAALNGLGQIALLDRNYKDAKKYLLKAAPTASAAWYGLARVYLLEGDWKNAERWAQKVVAAGEADDSAKQMLAAAKAQQLPDDLRRLIQPAEAAPSDEEFAQAWRYFNQGRNAEAREIFEKLLKEKPGDPNIENGLGWALLNSGDAAGAKPHFEASLKHNPDAGGALNGLARSLQAEGDLDGAVKVWQHMLKKNPGPNAGTFGLADAYLQQEKYQEAMPLLKQLVKLQPQNESLKSKLALAEEKAGK
jgi:Flp pilus assembly protein TadD